MDKYVKNGKITKLGEAFTSGLCWGMFIAGIMFVIANTSK
jgi:hypothetical protein